MTAVLEYGIFFLCSRLLSVVMTPEIIVESISVLTSTGEKFDTFSRKYFLPDSNTQVKNNHIPIMQSVAL